MPSILPGFAYDIFISYRQKDNKGDRWVSEFVEALKTEIEATFKEDISVYFDENPHDRLQETYNVDKSIEGKLKCLIFIPILSQTYCDPKSYAWQFEFMAFNRIAGTDPFGPHVRLKNGNVANRILPIRIHNLEPDDVKLFEQETGTVLRAVDFVFKTASGVNRPLRTHEDHPQDNLNKTFYRDQMNKVANAIKEIIAGLKAEKDKTPTGELKDEAPIVKRGEEREEREDREEREERKERVKRPASVIRGKLLFWVPVGILAVIAAVLVYPKIFKRDTLENLRSSGTIAVAVMPFQNMTADTTWNVWQDGIQDNLISFLSNSAEIKVRPSETINNLIQSKGFIDYASVTPSVAGEISQKLHSDIFINGSIKQAGTTIRVNAQLIDSKTAEVYKSFQIEGPVSKVGDFHFIDSLSLMVRDFLIISILDKEAPRGLQSFFSSFTNSPDAYRYFLLAIKAFRNLDFQTAINFHKQALAIDSGFTAAMHEISVSYANLGMHQEAKYWCLKLLAKRDQMSMSRKILTNWLYALLFETPNERIKCAMQLIGIDDQEPQYHHLLGHAYFQLYQYDKAIPECKTALDIYERWGVKPWWIGNYLQLGVAYHKTGQFNKEKKLYKLAEQDFPGDPALIYWQAILSLSEGDTREADRFIEKFISIQKDNNWSEAGIKTGIAEIYSEAGIPDKAEGFYRKAIQLEPENPARMENLAYFLIDKDRNINEGMALIERALKISPDNYAFIDTKGWGLYKEKKYEDALKLLQKSWDLRPVYSHVGFLHLTEVKQAIANQKLN